MLIPLFIRSTTGGAVHLMIHSVCSILELKKMIQDKDAVPISAQQLVFESDVLRDDLTLDDYNIEPNDYIDLFTTYGCSDAINFELCISSMTGKTVPLIANSLETVRSLKKKIEFVTEINACLQRLIFCGKLLEDSMTLADCNIHNWSTIHLMIRLIGSGDISAMQFNDKMEGGGDFVPSRITTFFDMVQNLRQQLCN